MAAIVKQTTVFIVVVLSVTHRLAEAGHVGHDRESAKIARYDQEKFGEHLDKDEGRDLSAKTRREVDTPVEKQPHFADFKRKTVNSMLWQTSRTQLEKEGLSLGTRLSTTGHLLNPESSGPHHIRTERDTTFLETQQKIRPKREVIIHPQLKPEVVMQVRIEMPMQKDTEEKYQEKLAQEKIPYLIDSRGNPLLFRPARTTPNPFIRQTNIEDYEIVKPNLGDQFRPISDADASDMESSYELSETSDIEYDSDYSISMSDPEDWENFPLTTPSGPNPGWSLSTLADIYQQPHRHRVVYREPNLAYRTIVRAKRSPKEKKRKIGKYREKLKERRKRKNVKRKRRIIRNSKEDKAAKEELNVDKAVENLLKNQVTRKRTTVYQLEDTSKEVLWYNKTHRVVEDRGATFKWLNKTHYVIYKENVTDKWHDEHHVLVYNEAYLENKTQVEKKARKKSQKDTGEEEEYDEDYYDEDFTEEEAEERANIEQKKKEMRDKERKLAKKKAKTVTPINGEERKPSKEEENTDVVKEKDVIKKEKKAAKSAKQKVKIAVAGSKEKDKKGLDYTKIDVEDKKQDRKDKDKKAYKKKIKKLKLADITKTKQEETEGKLSNYVKSNENRMRDKKGVQKKVQREESEHKVSNRKNGSDKKSSRKKPRDVNEGDIRQFKQKSKDKNTKTKFTDGSENGNKSSKESFEQKQVGEKKRNKKISNKENRSQKKTKTFKKSKSIK